ncbi:interleukin 15, like isoform X3 [Pempheris klunzingeri]|uniref:interleukin 15, like isoform X3 n=1 Tax=Pempheris klunzingeri TaxID=3127111 RepID=UPI00397F426D
MLRRRLALASVYLCLVCMLAPTPQPIAANLCTKDIIKKVQTLIGKAPKLWLDCRLYTPSPEDYEQNCPSSTMKCFADELKVLIQEWETIGAIHGFRFNTKVEKLASLLNQTKPECLRCELLKEETAETFLKGLHLTLQMMNFVHCPATTRHPPRKGLSKATS